MIGCQNGKTGMDGKNGDCNYQLIAGVTLTENSIKRLATWLLAISVSTTIFSAEANAFYRKHRARTVCCCPVVQDSCWCILVTRNQTTSEYKYGSY